MLRVTCHLWTLDLPADLKEGAHTATVTTIDAYGREYKDVIAFEVAEERPFPYFRHEVFE